MHFPLAFPAYLREFHPMSDPLESLPHPAILLTRKSNPRRVVQDWRRLAGVRAIREVFGGYQIPVSRALDALGRIIEYSGGNVRASAVLRIPDGTLREWVRPRSRTIRIPACARSLVVLVADLLELGPKPRKPKRRGGVSKPGTG